MAAAKLPLIQILLFVRHIMKASNLNKSDTYLLIYEARKSKSLAASKTEDSLSSITLEFKEFD